MSSIVSEMMAELAPTPSARTIACPPACVLPASVKQAMEDVEMWAGKDLMVKPSTAA